MVKSSNNIASRLPLKYIYNKYNNPDIAINGSFFEEDGTPSGTLVISGKIFSIKNRNQSLLTINKNNINIIKSNPYLLDKNLSIISGIPMLLENNIVPHELYSKTTNFYIKPHARTAIGIT